MVTLPSFVDQLVRLTTAFNRILRLSGATVQSAAFTEQGLVIALRRRRRRLWGIDGGPLRLVAPPVAASGLRRPPPTRTEAPGTCRIR